MHLCFHPNAYDWTYVIKLLVCYLICLYADHNAGMSHLTGEVLRQDAFKWLGDTGKSDLIVQTLLNPIMLIVKRSDLSLVSVHISTIQYIPEVIQLYIQSTFQVTIKFLITMLSDCYVWSQKSQGFRFQNILLHRCWECEKNITRKHKWFGIA